MEKNKNKNIAFVNITRQRIGDGTKTKSS